MKTLRHYTLLTSAIALLASMNSVASETTIAVTAENFSHAETARNYRNWAAQGANKGFVILERVMRGGMSTTSVINQRRISGRTRRLSSELEIAALGCGRTRHPSTRTTGDRGNVDWFQLLRASLFSAVKSNTANRCPVAPRRSSTWLAAV